jgi:hypothetical protein
MRGTADTRPHRFEWSQVGPSTRHSQDRTARAPTNHQSLFTSEQVGLVRQPRGRRRTQRWEGSRPRDLWFPKPMAFPDYKNENTPLASRTPSRRARTRALPVRGSSNLFRLTPMRGRGKARSINDFSRGRAGAGPYRALSFAPPASH